MEEQDQAPEETTDDSSSTDEGEIGGSAETPEPARIPSDEEREAESGDDEDDSDE